jgi:hypothetical protein
MSNLNLFAYSSEKTTQQTPVTVNTSTGVGSIPSITVDESEPQYWRLPTDGFSLLPGSINNAVGLITNKIRDGDTNLDSFYCLPPLNLQPLSDSTLDAWGYFGGSFACGSLPSGYFDNTKVFTNVAPGIYSNTSDSTVCFDGASATPDLTDNPEAIANLTDGNYSTGVTFNLTASSLADSDERLAIIGLSFNLPQVDFDFDAVYLGLYATSEGPALSVPTGSQNITVCSSVICMGKRGYLIGSRSGSPPALSNGMQFFGYANSPGNYASNMELGSMGGTIGGTEYCSLPNEYMDMSSIDTLHAQNFYLYNNLQYYGPGRGGIITYDGEYSGYQNYQLLYKSGSTTVLDCGKSQDYNAVSSLALLFPIQIGAYGYEGSNYTYQLKIREICLMYHKKTGVQDAVFSSLSGRTFGGPAGTHDAYAVSTAFASPWLQDVPINTEDTNATNILSDVNSWLAAQGLPAASIGNCFTVANDTATGFLAGLVYDSSFSTNSVFRITALLPAALTYAGEQEGVWSNRRPSSTLIADPVDMLEHVKRLQNWSEIATPAFTVGKQYDPNALIRTGTADTSDGCYNGSFDNPNLGAYGSATFGQVRACRPAFQIFDSGKAWTETVGRALCKTFGILSYIGPDGYECVESFEPYYPAGTGLPGTLQTIGFADLAERAGEVTEPEIQDVFCEPAIEYGYDPGAGKFQNFLIVSNTSQATWQASFTPGYDNAPGPNNFSGAGYDPFNLYGSRALGAYVSDGEYIWTVCRQLYLKYGQVEKCPSDFSEQPMIATYADALYYAVYKLKVMKYRRISLSVFYDKGRLWHVCQHLALSLPVLTPPGSTGPVWYECCIEKIQKSKNTNRVKVNLVMLNLI